MYCISIQPKIEQIKQRLAMITAESEYGPRSCLERCLADEEGGEADKRLDVSVSIGIS